MSWSAIGSERILLARFVFLFCLLASSQYVAADTAIYIDPRTGQITSESPVDDNPDAARREFQIQQEPETEPQEVPSPVPGGGMMVESRRDR